VLPWRTPLCAFALVLLLSTGVAWAATGTFKLTLRGLDAVPPGDRGDSARAVVTIDSKKQTICWTFTALKGVGVPIRAKVGRAAKGANGPTVFTFSTPFKPKGCSAAPARTLADVLKRPSSYYLVITNRAHPGGAVRAQL
jgi:hypothetical protein